MNFDWSLISFHIHHPITTKEDNLIASKSIHISFRQKLIMN
jgi:hypothetical protein